MIIIIVLKGKGSDTIPGIGKSYGKRSDRALKKLPYRNSLKCGINVGINALLVN